MNADHPLCAPVLELVRGELGVRERSQLRINSELADLGLDNLNLIEISLEAERVFEVTIEDDQVAEWETPLDIAITIAALQEGVA